MDERQPDISVVIPVFNGEENLDQLYTRLSACLVQSTRTHEIILVDDASRDRSWDKIKMIAERDERVKGIQLACNFGQHNALLCGIRSAAFPIIVTMDDDLQNPPEEIPRLLQKLEEGYDVVYGFPHKEQHGCWRDLASQLTKLTLEKAMGVDVARRISAFRVFRRSLREGFADYTGSFISIDVLLSWTTHRFAAIPVRHDSRQRGKSNYTFSRLLLHATNMLTGFTTLPLKLASLLGFTLTVFGILILFYVLVRYLIQGSVVPGFPFLASIIAIFSGAQLFALGIIGEYLARIHFRIMGKPGYVVKERISQ